MRVDIPHFLLISDRNLTFTFNGKVRGNFALKQTMELSCGYKRVAVGRKWRLQWLRHCLWGPAIVNLLDNNKISYIIYGEEITFDGFMFNIKKIFQ